MAKLDILNMTMINEKSFAVPLLVKADKNSVLVSEDFFFNSIHVICKDLLNPF